MARVSVRVRCVPECSGVFRGVPGFSTCRITVGYYDTSFLLVSYFHPYNWRIRWIKYIFTPPQIENEVDPTKEHGYSSNLWVIAYFTVTGGEDVDTRYYEGAQFNKVRRWCEVFSSLKNESFVIWDHLFEIHPLYCCIKYNTDLPTLLCIYTTLQHPALC